MVTLYTTHCPNCSALERMLKAKGIEFEKVEDREEIVKLGRAHNILSAPILKVDDEVYKFMDALRWIKKQ